jgi:hypothetical protein
MAAQRGKGDRQVRQVQDILDREYHPKHSRSRIDVYRYNECSIRIRILDPGFAKIDRLRRVDVVWDILEKLPDELVSQIDMVLPLTVKESKESASNFEFEYPSPPPPPKVHWTDWVASEHYPTESDAISPKPNGRAARPTTVRSRE